MSKPYLEVIYYFSKIENDAGSIVTIKNFARAIEEAILEKQKQDCEILKAETMVRLELAREEDSENGHIRADNALCALLRSLGFGEVTEVFEKLSKYYA